MNADAPWPGDGVTVNVGELMAARARVAGLAVPPTAAVSSLFPGAYRAVYHGRGLDFDEVRAYLPGDDFRTIDWRVTARSATLHTRTYFEEREHTLHIVLDLGPTMAFGTCGAFKRVTAARAGALFTWAAVEAGDRVATVVFGDGPACHPRRPMSSQAGALSLFRLWQGAAAHPPVAGTPSTLGDALAALRRRARPGSLVLVISDFARPLTEAAGHLAHLARRADVAAIHVYDALEAELPPPGRYALADGTRRMVLDSADAAVRAAHEQRFQARTAAAAQLVAGVGGRVVRVATDAPLVATLAAALAPRKAKAAS